MKRRIWFGVGLLVIVLAAVAGYIFFKGTTLVINQERGFIIFKSKGLVNNVIKEFSQDKTFNPVIIIRIQGNIPSRESLQIWQVNSINYPNNVISGCEWTRSWGNRIQILNMYVKPIDFKVRYGLESEATLNKVIIKCLARMSYGDYSEEIAQEMKVKLESFWADHNGQKILEFKN